MFRYKNVTCFMKRNVSTGQVLKSVSDPNRNPQLPNRKLFINNEWVEPISGKWIDTVNPSNGEVITQIPQSSQEDVDKAVAAARDAFHRNSPWRRMAPSKRGELIFKLAELLDKDRGRLTSLETLESGKLYSSLYRAEVPFAIASLKHYAGWADKNNGRTMQVDNDHIVYSIHEPVGVAGLIAPWNFPLSFLCVKLAFSLAAGCTTVLKASQHTTLSALRLAEAIQEAGFPPGVVNIVTGSGEVGSMLTEHPDVDVISFTGSTPVGIEVYKKSAKTLKRVHLGLGGKSPNIILKDADIDKAVDHAHLAVFHNVGQCCCAGTRTFVHESMYEEFVEKSKRKILGRTVGDPFDLEVMHGPQVTEAQLNTILDYLEKGKKEGAKLEVGGNRVNRPGYFVEPSLFTGTTDDMSICREEIFGPVQIITSYSSIDEVIKRANDSEFGLAAGIFGNNISDMMKISEGIRTGSAWLNCYFQIIPQAPFGGFKMSGIGREGGNYGLEPFNEVKCVYIKKSA